jgi:pimeloyl-ACP methyl ester carboxylesterase
MRRPLSRRLAFRDVMRRGELVSPADALALARPAIGCQVVDDVLAALRRGAADVVPQELHRVAVPVLIAWAERDRVLPVATCATRFRAELQGAEFRILPGVGHLPTWDNTRLVVDTITEWAARQAAVSASPA